MCQGKEDKAWEFKEDQLWSVFIVSWFFSLLSMFELLSVNVLIFRVKIHKSCAQRRTSMCCPLPSSVWMRPRYISLLKWCKKTSQLKSYGWMTADPISNTEKDCMGMMEAFLESEGNSYLASHLSTWLIILEWQSSITWLHSTLQLGFLQQDFTS